MTVRTGATERVFRVNPLVTSALFGLGLFAVVGVMASSAYLYLRDDVSRATAMQQARMQHLYEDRITSLRAQVDLATSRQLLDQQVVESRVTKLLLRQSQLGQLQEQVNQLIKRAGPKLPDETSSFVVPVERSGKKPKKGLRLGSLAGTHTPFAAASGANVVATLSGTGSEILDSVETGLAATEQAQIDELKTLKQRADLKLKKLASILSKQGVRVPADTGVGGPLIELKTGMELADSISALDDSLGRLEKLRSAALNLPHGSPTPGKKISSRYGTRRDPFTKRAAVHGGLDYRARRGTPVRATANGKVVKAGRFGGYGKLIEIDHGAGIRTRYAHLSKIKVKLGQRIKKGARIGNVGSTGRSTGPHLHYEVRRNGRTINPIHFVRLEKSLKPYL
ncbi:MAG: M23 family metallopeptidase [Rhizobiaceae bacterium]